MNEIDKTLQTYNFILSSFSEVSEIVRTISALNHHTLLIHITSFIHNTVLVQNLKQEIEKNIPDAKLVLLKHKDKSTTSLVVYASQEDIKNENISDNILRKFELRDKSNIQDLRDSRNQLLTKYFIDQLTDLPNIYKLRQDLEDKESFTLITIAIDDFSIINNFYGVMTGDYIIEQVATYLKENLTEEVYRVSGTEFTLCLEENLSFYELKKYLTTLYNKLKYISVLHQANEITLSLTIASCVNNDQVNLFSKVAMALVYAKEKRLPFWIYEDRMGFENEYEKNLDIANIVRYAVQNSKIVPYFQPIIDNKKNEIAKYECLARLFDKDGNIISPTLFIPIAKRIKVYNHVTKIIIDKSFEVFENNDYEFSINLSMEDIVNSEMFNFIINKLKSSSASNRLIFEIVESDAIQDFEKVARFINEIKRYGAKIAIDDFGDGYSNFSYLIKMNVDYLKIDGSLIQNIDTDKNSFLVVQTIVDFANKLNIETIAEFVHTSTIMNVVKEIGIDYSQGFHIDKPLISLDD